MDPFGRPDAPPPAAAGWYPDPGGSGSHRYWDGTRWTDALSSAIPPAGPHDARDDTRSWALAAHLSALLSLVVIGLVFVGPLVVYLVKKDDPFVRRHAAEALNFNLSFLLYAIVLGIVTFIGLFLIVGLLLIPLFFVLAIVWVVFVAIAAVKAGQGEEYRYPLTIRFVR
ncbi:MAG: DUF4870 domain-containing protein [Actinobacteria bacterium]|nr:DUF4870 domain-containing protein [Actinomycetota bacterium]